jgi:precorrin-2 dehydrogenase/sirohydrochlorin ferrochelatase
MHGYSIVLHLEHTHCLVVGAGSVGTRKIRGLLEAKPADILIVDPAEASGELRELLAAHSCLRFEQREFLEADLDGVSLVFAAAGSAEVNLKVVAACKKRKILVNAVDAPKTGDFHVPATARQGDISLTINTGGGSPALSRRLRLDLEAFLGDGYLPLAKFMAAMRPHVLAMGRPSKENTALFRSLVEAEVRKAMAGGDETEILEHLQKRLPEALMEQARQVLKGMS